jgi:WXG100 family type VII secretion target
MAAIYIDYSTTRANAKKLQQSASSFEDVSGNLENLQSEIPYYWNGDASDTFISAMSKWCSDTDKLAQDINAISTKIIRIADEFEAAEERIKAAAEAAAASVAGAATSALNGIFSGSPGSSGGGFGGGGGGGAF